MLIFKEHKFMCTQKLKTHRWNLIAKSVMTLTFGTPLTGYSLTDDNAQELNCNTVGAG